jgi:hypothetical protein
MWCGGEGSARGDDLGFMERGFTARLFFSTVFFLTRSLLRGPEWRVGLV